MPPYNHPLAGKLAVYAAASPEVREACQEKYSDVVTEIEDRVLPAHLVLLTMTSPFGRSRPYNRIRYRGRDVAQRLGETRGYGNVQLNAVMEIYPQIKEFLLQGGYKDRMGFGKGGPKEAWRNIGWVMQMMGIRGMTHSTMASAGTHGPSRWPRTLGNTLAARATTNLLPSFIRQPCQTLEKTMDATPFTAG